MTGIYKITCNSCDKFYLGQTGRPLIERFKEHLPTKNLDNLKSNYARHIIDNNHKYTSIEENMQLIRYCKKGKFMSAIEEFEIYKQTKKDPDKLLNDQLNFNSNQLYDTAIKVSTK